MKGIRAQFDILMSLLNYPSSKGRVGGGGNVVCESSEYTEKLSVSIKSSQNFKKLYFQQIESKLSSL